MPVLWMKPPSKACSVALNKGSCGLPKTYDGICSPVVDDRVRVLLSRAAQLTVLLGMTTSGCVVWLCSASLFSPYLVREASAM